MTKRILAVLMVCAIVLSMVVGVSAATVPNATIDPNKTGSITIYKYDFTQAMMDGTTKVNGTALNAYIGDAYISDGLDNAALREALTNPDASAAPGSENPANKPLGNGETSNGYAIRGVEFSYLKIGNIVQYSETELYDNDTPTLTDDDYEAHKVMVLYEMDDTQDAALLTALGLTNADAYDVQSHVGGTDDQFVPVSGKHYFEPDTLINALAAALGANPTTVKNALENYMSAQSAAKFDLTDENGMTSKDGLPLGLYLVVETKVPEMVTETIDPFFVQVPMTQINGTAAGNEVGGTEWLYDVTLFPKNKTAIPSLEKTVRESKDDTGKNNGSEVIDDGYLHNATASDNDVVEYQIIARIPTITSAATAMTMFTFKDTLGAGLEYVSDTVKVQIFKDADCTQKIDEWAYDADTISIEYGTGENNATTMTIAMTPAGLNVINTDPNGKFTTRPATEQGYSGCYMRVTYDCRVNKSDDVVYGDAGNPNTVTLDWQRTSMGYYDQLTDDCHVYTYELDINKTFDDGQGDPTKVQFKIFNDTDKYWVTAEENPTDSGIWYVNGHTAGTANESGEKGTTFTPGENGHLIIKGLEDDKYIITETVTDNGYNLLAKNITVVITATDDPERPCDVYELDPRTGVWQNKYTGETYNGTPYDQDLMAHNMLTASATVDNSDVNMLADNGSEDAIVPINVVNYHVPKLPITGEEAQIYLIIAAGALVVAGCVIFFLAYKKRKPAEDEAK